MRSNVRFWPKADMDEYTANVRFRGKADMPFALQMSANELKRTFCLCAGVGAVRCDECRR
jgi:hypothetical protein